MAELLLNEAEVVAARLVEVGPVGVAEAMDGEVRTDPGVFEAFLERLLEGSLGDGIPGDRREDVVFLLHLLAGVSLGFQEKQTSLLELQAEMNDACFPTLAHPDDE